MATTERCDTCRHEVPVGRWCNRCGAALAPVARRAGRRLPGRWLALAGTGLVVAVGATLVLASGTSGPADGGGARDDVVLEATASSTTPPRRAAPTGPVVVERPGGRPLDAAALPPEPRTNVVCSDLQVRAVPDAELSTTEEGELVELAAGPCVVMGPEGAAVPWR